MPEPTLSGNRLSGRVAIVTGGGQADEEPGIGASIARLFAAEGAAVVIADLNPHNADRCVEAIAQAGGSGIAICADVRDPQACDAIVACALATWYRLDVLVNNVGMGGGGARLEDVTVEAWRASVEINFDTAVIMTRAAMPALISAPAAAIVNIASVAGIRAFGGAGYGPAKAALIQFTRELALLYGRDGVRANAIVPGHLMTPFVLPHLDEHERALRRRIAALPIEGDAWDVAQAALFLAGAESRFITGTTLAVDGGVSEIGALAAYHLATSDFGQ